jgi:hypothetical protein
MYLYIKMSTSMYSPPNMSSISSAAAAAFTGAAEAEDESEADVGQALFVIKE